MSAGKKMLSYLLVIQEILKRHGIREPRPEGCNLGPRGQTQGAGRTPASFYSENKRPAYCGQGKAECGRTVSSGKLNAPSMALDFAPISNHWSRGMFWG